MSDFTQKYSEVFRKVLPSPFSIAIFLTVFVFVIAYFWGDASKFDTSHSRLGQIADY